MGKIKLNIVGVGEQEKEVISAFKIVNDSYVVFDNESTGSMGLPIILVSKIIGDKVSKIIDQNEWQKTKESLKLIIAGSQVQYIVVPSVLNSDEVYYTQLTLPEASFLAIKNNYKPEVPGVNVSTPEEIFVPNVEVSPIAPVQAPVVEPIISPVVGPINVPITPTPVVAPVVNTVPSAPIVTPVEPVVQPVVQPVVPSVPVIEVPVPTPVIAPVVEPVSVPTPTIMPIAEPVASAPIIEQIIPLEPVQPVVSVEPVQPVVQTPIVAPVVNTVPSAPIVTPVVPVVEPVVQNNINEVKQNEINYDDLKANFMKSCENMFEALVKQMKNKE